MALEYLTKGFFTLTSDVWSFGVVAWEILSFGNIPYGHQSYDEIVSDLEEGYRLQCPADILKHVTNWSPQILYQDLSELCFVADPKQRGTFSDAANTLEKELSLEEISRYLQLQARYQTKSANNYLKLTDGS